MSKPCDMVVMYSFYQQGTGKVGFGNVDAVFQHNPPTISNIRDMERMISTKHCGGAQVVVLNWKPITPEDIDE